MREEGSVVGESAEFHAVLEQARSLAALDEAVLVIGERGTGKEMIASRLHYLSERWEKPYIKLNCSALNESLLETELFGYEPGAFTGAGRRHQGRFERADGGTLFLDELATMSERLQEKVLRTIEYGELERVGGSETIRVSTRVVAATNENLPWLASCGRFRADLLDRLSFDVITIPPLRMRRDDILPLAEHFGLEMARKLRLELFTGFSERATEAMEQYPWPGNVRELKNVVGRSVWRNRKSNAPVEAMVFDPFSSPYLPAPSGPEEAVTAGRSLPADVTAEAAVPCAGDHLPEGGLDFTAFILKQEEAILRNALKKNLSSQKKTAEYLSLSYHQLRGLMKKHKIAGVRKTEDRSSG